ncbi:MAG: hypothetical protein WCT10_03045 [Patescibacteria group bacterium]|jgi:uncharacterized membrane protein YhaH (DUF805 family)
MSAYAGVFFGAFIIFLLGVIVNTVVKSVGKQGDDATISRVLVCCMFLLGIMVATTSLAVNRFGQARFSHMLEVGQVQEVLGAFTLEDGRSFALLRDQSAGTDVVYYELAQPLPAAAKCVIFTHEREKTFQDPTGGRALATVVDCPAKQ